MRERLNRHCTPRLLRPAVRAERLAVALGLVALQSDVEKSPWQNPSGASPPHLMIMKEVQNIWSIALPNARSDDHCDILSAGHRRHRQDAAHVESRRVAIRTRQGLRGRRALRRLPCQCLRHGCSFTDPLSRLHKRKATVLSTSIFVQLSRFDSRAQSCNQASISGPSHCLLSIRL